MGSEMEIRALDLPFQGVPGVIAAYLIESNGERALIETGPGSTLASLIEALGREGVAAAEITKVFVTHVHLDHAGSAGWWANQGATIFCHERAQRHLIDPSRLLAGAKEVYGEAMEGLWGAMVPAPAERVKVLRDGEGVVVGGVEVIAWDTPGHARHHHAYAVGKACFTGDVAGIRLAGSNYLSVAAAPPQFELGPYLESVARLRKGGFERLFLTHYGEVTDVADHLDRYADRLREVAGQVKRVMDAGGGAEWAQSYANSERLKAEQAGVSGALWKRYELANGSAMCADGLRMWAERPG
jgi:glyoxylase-like metal-dependent hydrolase (beta-lactamase superfamily II)